MYNVRFFPNKNRNYFKPYGHILLIFFFSFLFPFLLNIKMETNYHSNFAFLYTSKNYQIHSYSRGI